MHCIEIKGTRTRGDLQGHFTYLGYQGYSTVDLVLASENIFQTNLIQYLSVQTFTTFSDHRLILLKILWKHPTRIDETKTSVCTQEDKPQSFIWNNKLEKLYTEALEKESRRIIWKDFNELQTNKIKNKNVEIENFLSNVEDTFINTAGKFLRKTRKHKESEVKKGKLEIKNGLAKLVMTNIKS